VVVNLNDKAARAATKEPPQEGSPWTIACVAWCASMR
jgi:hypothetical protein